MIIFFFLLALFAFPAAQAQKIELRVAEKSTVRVGDPIRLGPLIYNSINEPDIESKLYNLVVFEALSSEGEKIFKSEELALTLRRKLSFQDLQRLSLKIPESFTIRAQRNFLYSTDISREIREQARLLCSQCDIEFDDLRIPNIKSKEELLRVRLEAQSLKAAGGFLLPLHVETSKTRNVFWVTGKVSFYKEVPVAKRMIQSNDRITSNDVEIKRVNVSFARDGFPELKDLEGKLASRTLAVGQPIFMADLKKELAATRGQVLKVVVGNESFEISSSGIAEEAGSVGDLIRVKSPDAKKVMSGVLVDKGVVKIQ